MLYSPNVEFNRHNKILNSIREFDYGDRKIDAVSFHVLQLEPGVESFDFAETATSFTNGRASVDY